MGPKDKTFSKNQKSNNREAEKPARSHMKHILVLTMNETSLNIMLQKALRKTAAGAAYQKDPAGSQEIQDDGSEGNKEHDEAKVEQERRKSSLDHTESTRCCSNNS